MGNIVSQQGGTPTQQPIEPLTSPAVPTQPAGYGVDPLGEIPLSVAQPVTEHAPEPPSITPDPIQTTPQEQPLITAPTTTTASQTPAEQIVASMPSIEQMMKDLEKSGCLLPDLRIGTVTQKQDQSPLAALQPHRLREQGFVVTTPNQQPATPILPDVQLATTVQRLPEPADEKSAPMFVITASVLLVQAVQGVVQLFHFLRIGYPRIEQQIMLGQLTTVDMNTAVIQAIILAGTTLSTGLISTMLFLCRPKLFSILFFLSVIFVCVAGAVQNILLGPVFASGNPLSLPSILAQLLATQ